jgi:UDP-N-acetylmuramyl pentapeptide phosphotransferase/UDP-N-acetylglucosamine-1-phosphate transferase
MLTGYGTYEMVLLGAMLLSIVATPVVIHIARKRRLMDQPGVRKVHASAIPRIGGIAIVFTILAVVLLVLRLDNRIGEALRNDWLQILAILGGGLFMCIVGLIDDVRGLRPKIKLLCQLAAALAVCASGARIEQLHLGDWSANLGWWSWPLTLAWIVGVTNAVNLIDGLDGLAAGISTIACGVIAIFAIYIGLPITAVVMLAMVGSLLGFLFLNFNPARIFMGDCGSLFLGFVISAASVRCSEKAATIVGLAVPFLALGVPIFDTLFSIMRRVLHRRGVFSGDRGHIHHRLLDMGLDQHHVAILVYLVTLVVAGLGLFMMFLDGAATVAIFLAGVVLLVLVFRAAGAVRWYETLAAYRRLRNVLKETKAMHQKFDDVDLLFRDVHDVQQWWQAMCTAARQMQFLSLSLEVRDPTGAARTLTWQNPDNAHPPQQRINMGIPMRQSADLLHKPAAPSQDSAGQYLPAHPMRANAEVYVNGSVESAGRRIALFGRLLDEHGLASLQPPSQTPALDRQTGQTAK